MLKSELFIKIFSCLITFYIAEDNFFILSIIFHHLNNQLGGFISKAVSLIMLIYKELTKTVFLFFIYIVIHCHSNWHIIIIYDKRLTPTVAIGICSGKDSYTVRDEMLLIFSDTKSEPPIIRCDCFQMYH